MLYPKIKRILDVAISLFGLLLISPFLILIAVLIKIDSKGPVIFKQDRIGLNGNTYKIFKFRSMCVGAEKDGVYEKQNDVRVTRVGKIIRKTSIDELPQFLNIIRGEMSLIGPRPPLTYHPWPYEEYTVEQKRRFSVRPGVTGWAQVNGRKDVPWDRRIEFDVEYVEKMSFLFDLKIMAKTVLKVLTMKDNVNTSETAVPVIDRLSSESTETNNQ